MTGRDTIAESAQPTLILPRPICKVICGTNLFEVRILNEVNQTCRAGDYKNADKVSRQGAKAQREELGILATLRLCAFA